MQNGIKQAIEILSNQVHTASFSPIVIGSRALAARHKKCRTPNDWDVLVDVPYIVTWLNTRKQNSRIVSLELYEIVALPKTKALFGVDSIESNLGKSCLKCQLYTGSVVEFKIVFNMHPETSLTKIVQYVNGFGKNLVLVNDPLIPKAVCAPIPLLYTLKTAHMYWPTHWVKTMEDIYFLKSTFGEVMCPNLSYPQRQPVLAIANSGPVVQDNALLLDILQTHRVELEHIKPHPPVNLNQTNEAFFAKSANALRRVFDHDALHRLVAFDTNRPAFLKFKRDKTKAALDLTLFRNGSQQDKLNLVREEIMVIALERFIIPSCIGQDIFFCFRCRRSSHIYHQKPNDCDPLTSQMAYINAFEKVCTRLSKGWFREFALENYAELKWSPKDICAIAETLINPYDFRDLQAPTVSQQERQQAQQSELQSVPLCGKPSGLGEEDGAAAAERSKEEQNKVYFQPEKCVMFALTHYQYLPSILGEIVAAYTKEPPQPPPPKPRQERYEYYEDDSDYSD